MAFTIYEYPNVIDGEPAQPAGVRKDDAAVGQSYALASTTRYVAIVPGADMYLRLSVDGSPATSADHKLLAGQSYGFPVRKGDPVKLYGLAA